jgi:hypothetical protein
LHAKLLVIYDRTASASSSPCSSLESAVPLAARRIGGAGAGRGRRAVVSRTISSAGETDFSGACKRALFKGELALKASFP